MTPTASLPLLQLRGDHYQIGRTYGQACAQQIRTVLGTVYDMVERRLGTDASWARQEARKYLPYVEELTPHLVEEIHGLADGADIDFLDALAIQCRTELAYKGDGQCTSFAVTGDLTQDGGLIVGQNVDWLAVMDHSSVILHLMPEGGPQLLIYANAGLLGYPGMNSAGLVLCLNMLVSDGWTYGLPSILLMRAMLEQTSIEAAERLLARWPRSSSRNYLLADRSGRAVDFECLVTTYRALDPEDGVLAHANNFCDPEFAQRDRFEDLPDSAARCSRMYDLLRGVPKPLTVEAVKGLLADHANYPASVCRHPSGKPEKLPIKTNASFIAEPAKGLFHITPGNPCTGHWVTYAL